MKTGYALVLSLVLLSGCFNSHEHSDSCCNHDHGAHHPAQITLGFMGDVMLGRDVNETIKQYGPQYIWGTMRPVLEKTDVIIANLETTLTRNTGAVPKVFNFKADPDYVKALKEGHISVVNLANNRSLDFGVPGLKDTLSALMRARIRTVGAGMTEQEARRPLIFHKHGFKIGILGYTDNEPSWDADGAKPGTNYVPVPDVSRIKEDIHKIRHAVDILIVTIHWGPNMLDTPLPTHVTAAHEIIDAGADIIHGHSAHVFQGIEVYKNKVILYDTGDFIDDYAVDDKLHNDWSAFVKITATKKCGITKIKLIPVEIAAMQVNRALDTTEEHILERIQRRSRSFGTQFEAGTISLEKAPTP